MRQASEITIWRFSSDEWASVPVEVAEHIPITTASRRKFHLMTEDSITLVFSLAQPIEFKVGDYISDPVFGRFFLREKQLPTYNKATAGYDYQLRFDRAYWLWENHIDMLSVGLANADPITPVESDGTITLTAPQLSLGEFSFPYKRKESIWCLTNSLAYHVQQILYNLLAAGLLYNGKAYSARILPSAKMAKEIRFISYDATHICSALTQLANEFECEWWVTYDGDYGWINFGKCELDNTPKEFRLKDMEGLNVVAGNVETLQASSDLTNYANRIYVFGGTQNMPESYRKKLLLDIDTSDTIGGVTCYKDSYREINPYTMLIDSGTEVAQNVFKLPALTHLNIPVTTVVTPGDNQIVNDQTTLSGHSIIKYRSVATKVGGNETSFGFKRDTTVNYTSFSAGVSFSIGGAASVSDPVVVNVEMELKVFLEEYDAGSTDPTNRIYLSENPLSVTKRVENNQPSATIINIPTTIIATGGKATLSGGKTYKLVLECKATFSSVVDFGQYYPNSPRDLTLSTEDQCKVTIPTGKTFAANVIWNNETHPVTFNPAGDVEGEENTSYFAFDNGVPSGFNTPQTVELLDYFAYAIPLSYYTDDTDDPSSLIGLGERRLRLPTKNGGQPDSDNIIVKDGYAEVNNVLEVQRAEMVVKNDNIYPKCYLKVTSVKTEPRRDVVEYSDGTRYEWEWTAYTIQAELLTTAQDKSFRFKTSFVKEGEKLKASFLSDYNEQKACREMGVPWSSHDGYLLAGMTFEVAFRQYGSEYTLIRNEDYGAKLPSSLLMPKEGDTFILTGWDVKAMDSLNLVRTAENQLASFAKTYLKAMQEDGWTFRCGMMTDMDEPLYAEGTKVRVYHESLVGGYKQSRIIGYELRLDIPEDSPVYEVGETDAYSRIKALERSLTKSESGYIGNLADVDVDMLPVIVTIDGVQTTSAVGSGEPLSMNLSPGSGKQILPWTVVVTMGETDVTSSAYDKTTNTITIASVTDAVSITASGITMSSAYKPVEYIQNLEPAAGKRFVTDYYPTDTTEVIADVNVMALTNYSGVFGTMTSSTPYFALMARYSGSYGRGWWGNKALESSAFGAYLAISTRQTITMGKGSLSYLPNGGDAYRTLTFDSTVTTPWTSPNVLQIGGYISGGTTLRGIQLRIYGLQIKEGNTIVRNYVPCQRISDNYVGLYDTINNAFLGQYDGNSDWTIPT